MENECDICRSTFNTVEQLETHHRQCILLPSTCDCPECLNPSQAYYVEIWRPHMCLGCDLNLQTVRHRDLHEETCQLMIQSIEQLLEADEPVVDNDTLLLKCWRCEAVYYTYPTLVAHENQCVGLTYRERLMCHHCGSDFSNLQRLDHHIVQCSILDTKCTCSECQYNPPYNNRHKCRHCQVVLPTIDHYRLHRMTCDDHNINGLFRRNGINMFSLRVTCVECNLPCNTYPHMLYHQIECLGRTSEDRLLCKYCGTICVSSTALDHHVAICSTIPLHCDCMLCNTTYNDHLKRHLKFHHFEIENLKEILLSLLYQVLELVV